MDGTQIEAPQALLVSNNPYETEDIAGLGRRARLDGGGGHRVSTVVERATGLGDAVRLAGGLSARTMIFDVEPRAPMCRYDPALR